MKPGFRPLTLFALLCAASLWGQNTSVAITWPANNETVANIIAVKGKSAGTVSSVAVSLDGGAYSPIDKTGSPAGWRFTVYTKNLPVGRHTVVARATGASGATVYSAPVTFNVVHPTQDCNHSLVGAGIFCEEKATDAQSPSVSNPSSTVNLTFSGGYAATVSSLRAPAPMRGTDPGRLPIFRMPPDSNGRWSTTPVPVISTTISCSAPSITRRSLRR